MDGKSGRISRAALLRGTAGLAAATAATWIPLEAFAAEATRDELFRALDRKIESGMARYRVPGVAVGMLYEGEEYVRGYGVTNVNDPQPVDGDTLFRIGSTTKTFTATAIMRLVDEGKVDLDAPVSAYVPDLKLADETVARRVTVRQLLNHSAGWMGNDYANYSGDAAIEKYVAGMEKLPQLTPVGKIFSYNNAAFVLAGRLIEVVTGMRYEDALKTMLLDPLGLKRTGFFTESLGGNKITASHTVEKEKIVVDKAAWTFPRSLNPTGGLISTAREQLRYAKFHLGDGRAGDGTRVLSSQSLRAMRSTPGPGGTIVLEIDGVCVSWWLRRTAQRIPVFQHGGSWGGQNSDFFFVPSRRFAMTLLTNSTTSSQLIDDIGYSGWALQQFVRISNPPAVPKSLSRAQLAPYEGRYQAFIIPADGPPDKIEEQNIEIRAAGGQLRVTGDAEHTLAFYRDDYVVVTDTEGKGARCDFVRGPDGNVAWFRDRGRLFARRP